MINEFGKRNSYSAPTNTASSLSIGYNNHNQNNKMIKIIKINLRLFNIKKFFDRKKKREFPKNLIRKSGETITDVVSSDLESGEEIAKKTC